MVESGGQGSVEALIWQIAAKIYNAELEETD